MGWFWADSSPRVSPNTVSASLPPSHPPTRAGAKPPPECPMHNKTDKTPSPLTQRLQAAAATTTSSTSSSSCPVKSPTQSSRYPTTPNAPISPPAQPSSTSKSWSASLNPLNFMPTFKNERPVDSAQTINLPLERETSTIPRGDSDSNWEYPSPQQMYNAMLRKGHTDTPAEDVEAMVAVHNFLNEGAWEEIVTWESLFASGLSHGWEKCKKGEEGIARTRAMEEYRKELAAQRRQQAGLKEDLTKPDPTQPRLLRFQGRPQEPTPKARILSILGYCFPQSFSQDPPFDRHDWYVARTAPDGNIKEVRYVIDYYGGGLQATGEPVFYLDIRPALDSPVQACERLMRWGGDVWYRATGSGVREELARQKMNEKGTV